MCYFVLHSVLHFGMLTMFVLKDDIIQARFSVILCTGYAFCYDLPLNGAETCGLMYSGVCCTVMCCSTLFRTI